MKRNRIEADSKTYGLGAASKRTNSNTMNDLSKEGIEMTNRKFSRKRIGQTLGLLVLGLALLVGSTGYGSADYGRTGGHLPITEVARQEQEPVTFSAEGVVNARGGLEVRLPLPGFVQLSVQFVVRGDTIPHRLVDPGTAVSIVGLLKKGITVYRTPEDIAVMMFFATVPVPTSGAEATAGEEAEQRELYGEVTSFSWATFLGITTLSPANEQRKVLLVYQDDKDPLTTFTAPFSCCERNVKLTGGPNAPALPDTVVSSVLIGADREVVIQFDMTIEWECDTTRAGSCVGSIDARVVQHPHRAGGAREERAPLPAPAPTLTIIRIWPAPPAPDPLCTERGPHSATLRVRYTARYQGAAAVDTNAGGGSQGLVIEFFAGDRRIGGVRVQKRPVVGPIFRKLRIDFDTANPAGFRWYLNPPFPKKKP